MSGAGEGNMERIGPAHRGRYRWRQKSYGGGRQYRRKDVYCFQWKALVAFAAVVMLVAVGFQEVKVEKFKKGKVITGFPVELVMFAYRSRLFQLAEIRAGQQAAKQEIER